MKGANRTVWLRSGKENVSNAPVGTYGTRAHKGRNVGIHRPTVTLGDGAEVQNSSVILCTKGGRWGTVVIEALRTRPNDTVTKEQQWHTRSTSPRTVTRGC